MSGRKSGAKRAVVSRGRPGLADDGEGVCDVVEFGVERREVELRRGRAVGRREEGGEEVVECGERLWRMFSARADAAQFAWRAVACARRSTAKAVRGVSGEGGEEVVERGERLWRGSETVRANAA